MYIEMDHIDEVYYVEDAHSYLSGHSMLDESDIIGCAEPIRKKCGVYFLIQGERIVYVGQSTDIESRVRAHESKKHFDAYHYVEVDPQMLDQVESFYIVKFRPRLNGIHKGRKGFGKSRGEWLCTPLSRSSIFHESPSYCELVRRLRDGRPLPRHGTLKRVLYDNRVIESKIMVQGIKRKALLPELGGTPVLVENNGDNKESWRERIREYARLLVERGGGVLRGENESRESFEKRKRKVEQAKHDAILAKRKGPLKHPKIA